MDHRLTISSIVFPLSIDGGGTATIAVEVAAGVLAVAEAERTVLVVSDAALCTSTYQDPPPV